ncbi:MAG: hypothetical protein HPY79_06810 [Bacteroidales bacterium]|nr:hypothetical protein [Bacteroidales bacterium]
MKKQLLFLIFISIILSSCTTLKTNTNKTMDIYGPGVIHLPVVVDLDVKETRVSGTATSFQSGSIEQVKQDAITDAIKKSNADILIEPKFETEIKGNQITATVTGFPANYKNFRQIKPEDVELLKVGVVQKAQVTEQPATVAKKANVAGAVIGTVLGVVLFVTILAIAI